MKISELSIQWFRGASEAATLATDGKSVVVYGPNGAGKTSFVDGLEFLLGKGKIAHLSHEYARQIPAVVNTHTPPNAVRRVALKLHNGQQVAAALSATGAAKFGEDGVLAGWDKGRIVLRQDEVADFVQGSKADKYSALLPLIGLGPLENVAANLRGLAKKVKEESKVDQLRGQLQQMQRDWDTALPGVPRSSVGDLIKKLYAKYLPDQAIPGTLAETLAALKPVLEARITGLNAEQARHLHIKTIHDANLVGRLANAATASEKAAALAEPLLEERLAVLRSAQVFGGKLEAGAMVPCPACGREISAEDFNAHAAAESTRLETALAAFEERRLEFGVLADGVSTARTALGKLADWLAEPAQVDVSGSAQALLTLDLDRLRKGLTPPELGEFRQHILTLAARVEQAAKTVPPSVADLVKDQKCVDAAASDRTIRSHSAAIKSIDELLAFLGEAEAQVRNEIKAQTESVIADISTDMQRMWSVLHPGEPIDEVHLYQAEDAEKAIDIALRFHGKEQPSPRLTLSEGHRNSLGLCVFFALAKKGGLNHPLILDDVVTSFDREHRSFVADLLKQEFPDTQVLLFTHDLDWYVELRRVLPRTKWECKVLLPWVDPPTGIRWDVRPNGLGAARALLDTDTGAAANRARAIMDIEMAVIAELLEIPMPFIRGARNEQRGAQDLLDRFKGRASGHFKRKDGQGSYVTWPGPAELAKSVVDLLVIHGNAGSHGRYVARAEAERLIVACEAFLTSLECPDCKTDVWHAADADRDHLRCNCDGLRWKLKH